VFDIDLDLPANQRWSYVAKQTRYFDNLWLIYNTMDAVFTDIFMDVLDTMMNTIYILFPEPYKSEIDGISSITTLPRGFIVFLNMIYEITNGCTSIAVQSSTNETYIVRNQDLGLGMGFTDLLRNQTIHARFKRNGTIVYEGVTFAGYVGLPTGFLNGSWGISVNSRNVNGTRWQYLERVVEMFVTGKAEHIATWVVRDGVDNADTFNAMVSRVSSVALVTDIYFILAGTVPGQGVVVTRNQTATKDLWWVNATEGRWFVAQTNYDHWEKPPWYDDRIAVADAEMKAMGFNNVTLPNLYNVLSTVPVLNALTLYTSLMHPARGIFISDHRYCGGGQFACPD